MKIHPDKSRGQNFLIDKNVLGKIVTAAELKPSDTIIEIGAGTGVLTAELAKQAKKVIAFEIDKKLIPILRENLKDFKNVEIVNEDILRVGATPCGRPPLRYKIIANIPYNITSAVLEKFLSADCKGEVTSPLLMVLMVQREVAERICAPSGKMSLLSVMVQYYGQPEIVARVPASAFWPAPKVDSAILKINVGASLVGANHFFQIVKAGFSHRRKMLKNNLVGAYCNTPLQIVDILTKAGLSPTVRAQELSVEDWKKLTLALLSQRR